MPYTTPHTITVGELVTVDTMNDEWGGNVAFLANPPSCRVYNNANISVADNTVSTVSGFNTERWDTNSMHSTVTNSDRITINTAGLYIVTFAGLFESGNDYDEVFCAIRLNGGNHIAEATASNDADTTSNPRMSVTTVYKLAVADYLTVRVYQNNATNAARNLVAQANTSPEFGATWIGLG